MVCAFFNAPRLNSVKDGAALIQNESRAIRHGCHSEPSEESLRVAIAREKQIKGWLRARKIALIDSFNAHWRDLAPELQSPTPNRVSF